VRRRNIGELCARVAVGSGGVNRSGRPWSPVNVGVCRHGMTVGFVVFSPSGTSRLVTVGRTRHQCMWRLCAHDFVKTSGARAMGGIRRHPGPGRESAFFRPAGDWGGVTMLSEFRWLARSRAHVLVHSVARGSRHPASRDPSRLSMGSATRAF
jgi:hypothetical protein